MNIYLMDTKYYCLWWISNFMSLLKLNSVVSGMETYSGVLKMYTLIMHVSFKTTCIYQTCQRKQLLLLIIKKITLHTYEMSNLKIIIILIKTVFFGKFLVKHISNVTQIALSIRDIIVCLSKC